MTHTIDTIMKRNILIIDMDFQRDIDNIVKTHLLRNRVELVGVEETQSLSLVTRRLRHYLTMVIVPTHQKAMTGLLLPVVFRLPN